MPQSVKFTLAIALVIAAIIFGYYQYTKASPTYQAARLQAMDTTASLTQIVNATMIDREDREGPPSAEDMAKRREEIYKAIGVTSEQRAQLAELEKQSQDNRTSGSWQARREATNKILTPEQQQKQNDYFRNMWQDIQQSWQQRNAQRMKSLSPADQAAYQKKMAERRGQWGNRGGRGGGPGGPGGGIPPVPGGGVPPVPGGGNPPKVQ